MSETINEKLQSLLKPLINDLNNKKSDSSYLHSISKCLIFHYETIQNLNSLGLSLKEIADFLTLNSQRKITNVQISQIIFTNKKKGINKKVKTQEPQEANSLDNEVVNEDPLDALSKKSREKVSKSKSIHKPAKY